MGEMFKGSCCIRDNCIYFLNERCNRKNGYKYDDKNPNRCLDFERRDKNGKL